MNRTMYGLFALLLAFCMFTAGYMVGQMATLRSIDGSLSKITAAVERIDINAARSASNLDRIESRVMTQ